MYKDSRRDQRTDMKPPEPGLQGVRDLPVQVPLALIDQHAQLGGEAILAWLHLAAASQKQEGFRPSKIQEAMGLGEREFNRALAILADAGWLADDGRQIRLQVPRRQGVAADVITSEEREQGAHVPEADQNRKSGDGPEPALDDTQAGFEWLIDFWTHRVSPPTQAEMERLLFWMETRGISHEVIAIGIEEMCAAVDEPAIAYLEGILRNWLKEGVHSYASLRDKPHLSKVLMGKNDQQELDPAAAAKWKELFPDEFC